MKNTLLPPPDRVNFKTSEEYKKAYSRWRDKHDPKRIAFHKAKYERRKAAGLWAVYYDENREKLLEQKREYYTEKREEIRLKQKLHRLENLGAYKARDAERYRENLAAAAQGGRAKRNAPPWLTREHWRVMSDMYEQAQEMTKRTGILHVVDHIWPLKGKHSCGLHVPWNLQILTNAENTKKRDKEPL